MNNRSIPACLVLVCLAAAPLFGQGGFMGHTIDQNLVFPHFVLGPDITTELIIMNPRSGSAVTGTLFFFRQDGNPLQVSSGGQNVNQLQLTVPAGGTSFVNVTTATQELTIGWALLEVAAGSGENDLRSRLSGSVIFTTTQDQTTVGSVGVVASRFQPGAPHRQIAIPVTVRGTSINTGVALVNSGSEPSTLTIQLRNAAGNVVQNAATIEPPISPLAPGNQVARFVTELFQGFGFNDNDFQGTLVVSTEQEGLEAVGLLTTGPLLTSIPVVHFGEAQTGGGAQTHQVTNQGFAFSPSSLTITAGDSVRWTIENIHNVVEVTQATWNANGNTARPNGFSTSFGGGTVLFNVPGSYWYVCSPHATEGMKGTITVNPAQ
jgi:plastocyanin